MIEIVDSNKVFLIKKILEYLLILNGEIKTENKLIFKIFFTFTNRCLGILFLNGAFKTANPEDFLKQISSLARIFKVLKRAYNNL